MLGQISFVYVYIYFKNFEDQRRYFWLYHVNICFSCPFVCINRTIAESKKKHEEKQMKAQQLREKLREQKTLKLQKLLERVSF